MVLTIQLIMRVMGIAILQSSPISLIVTLSGKYNVGC